MSTLKTKLVNPSHWLQLLIMILMCFILVLAVCYVIPTIFVVQWVLTLFTNKQNVRLKSFSSSLNAYLHQILRYLSFHSDQAPFPLSDWPTAE